MQPRVIQTDECVYIWTSLNITQFTNCTLLLEIAGNYWTIMESLQLFPAFSLYRSLAVIACWFPAKQLSGEKHFQTQKCGCEITPWTTQSHRETLTPRDPTSRFFFIFWPHTAEVGPWWCLFNWCPLCSQICCNAVWQLQYKECLPCFENLLCKHTTENFSCQKSKDERTCRYISTHIKKPLELLMQFNPGVLVTPHFSVCGPWDGCDPVCCYCAVFLSRYFYFCTTVSSYIALVNGVYLVLFIHFKLPLNVQVRHELSDPVWRFCQC